MRFSVFRNENSNMEIVDIFNPAITFSHLIEQTSTEQRLVSKYNIPDRAQVHFI